ncbi:hypothetical protein PoMZ_09590, partial [Pyricularia oryzae]
YVVTYRDEFLISSIAQFRLCDSVYRKKFGLDTPQYGWKEDCTNRSNAPKHDANVLSGPGLGMHAAILLPRVGSLVLLCVSAFKQLILASPAFLSRSKVHLQFTPLH